jgi:hypothetical protein
MKNSELVNLESYSKSHAKDCECEPCTAWNKRIAQFVAEFGRMPLTENESLTPSEAIQAAQLRAAIQTKESVNILVVAFVWVPLCLVGLCLLFFGDATIRALTN